MYRLLTYLVFVLYCLFIFSIVRCTPTPQRYYPVPVEYTRIQHAEHDGGSEMHITVEKGVSFQPCTTDMECYEVCMDMYGDPDWCEEGLMTK